MPLPMVVDTVFRSEERFTQQEFFEWLQRRPASDVNHYELIRGRIVTSPPAGWPHGSLEVRIASRLLSVAEAHDLGVVQGPSAGYDLPSGDTLEPDVSFMSKVRFAAGPAPVRGRYGTGSRFGAGRVTSHVLPQLDLTVEDLFAD